MDEIKTSIKKYFTEWHAWAVQAKEFAFGELKPVHAAWKVPDEASLGQKITELLPYTNQSHIGTVDNRKIALLVQQDQSLEVPVIQIMQRRPGTADPLGLDHVAFYCADMAALESALKTAPYKWEHQSNPGHAWISLWFGDSQREAKFFDHTSLDLGARGLKETSQKIING